MVRHMQPEHLPYGPLKLQVVEIAHFEAMAPFPQLVSGNEYVLKPWLVMDLSNPTLH